MWTERCRPRRTPNTSPPDGPVLTPAVMSASSVVPNDVVGLGLDVSPVLVVFVGSADVTLESFVSSLPSEQAPISSVAIVSIGSARRIVRW